MREERRRIQVERRGVRDEKRLSSLVNRPSSIVHRQSKIVAVVFLTFFSGTCWAVREPVIISPVGSGRVPPSSGSSGLVRSPNPIDRSGNLIITGNVAGGRHFQGVVPYGATSSFGAAVGSSSLDSFLRRSASSGDFDTFAGGYTPYYSPSATVTTTRAGSSGVFGPAGERIGGYVAGGFAQGASSAIQSGRQQALSGLDTAISEPSGLGLGGIRYRPMRYTPQELEKLIADGVATYAQAKRIADEQNLAQMERLRQDLERLRYRSPQLRQSLIMRDESLRPLAKIKGDEDVLQLLKLPKPKEQTGEEGPEAQKGAFGTLDKESDVYEQMKRRIDELQKGLETTREEGAGGKVEEAAGEKRLSAEELELLRLGVRISKSQEMGTGGGSQREMSPLDALSEVEVSDKAKRVLGPHKTFASYSNDEFNQHIRAAEMHLKEGRYYRAADYFTLASIYKPDDPLAYAGKSHALFAAGDYLSSALFLSRALEIFPEYAQFKVDLVAMVGDRDKLESRIADVEEWLKISKAPELQFLLGYVYFQMGRLERAKEAIDAAYEKLPDSPAVIALKRAIDSAAAGTRPGIK